MTMPAEVLGITIVLGALGLLALWSRRGQACQRRLHVVETAPLGQGRAVAVVRAGSKRLLIGVTGQSIATLAELDPSEWQEAPAEIPVESLEIEAT